MNMLLFATRPTDDLALLTRLIPIVTKRAQRRHEVMFCNLAKATWLPTG
jgi:hypothetical protein